MTPGEPSLVLDIATASDVGRRRTHNEDRVAVLPGPEGGVWAGGVLMVVADGMGGANAGEVASEMAVDTLARRFFESSGSDPAESLRTAVEAANDQIWTESSANTDWSGMGTTCTALWVKEGAVWMAHVGDSRAYLVREGRAHLLTQDHSLVAQLVQRGQLTAEQARTDPRRNVVTRSVGAAATIDVDAGALDQPLQFDDVLVICSDGLHGQMGEDEMAWYASGESIQKACEELVALANDRGGPDNISVVLARAVPGPPRSEGRSIGGVFKKLFGGAR